MKAYEALQCYICEVSNKFDVLNEDHSPSSHKTVDQRLLPHLFANSNPKRDKIGSLCNREEEKER